MSRTSLRDNSGDFLDLSRGGVFSRASEGAYYLTGATDGTTAFLSWSSNDVRRIENRGDGYGNMLLLEGSRINRIYQSRDVFTSWSSATAGVISASNVLPGPDGQMLADRCSGASSTIGRWQSRLSPPNTFSYGSAYAIQYSGSTIAQCAVGSGEGASGSALITISNIWKRISASAATITNTNQFWIPWAGRTNETNNVATSYDYVCDLHQLEAGYFPSSPIRTTGNALTRSADILYFPPDHYPNSFLANGFNVQFAPDASSDEIISGSSSFVLASVDSNNYLSIEASASACKAKLVCSGTVVASLFPLSFPRQNLLTITAKPGAGFLYISGTTSGDALSRGSAGRDWPRNRLYIGSATGSTAFSFGRFSNLSVPVLPTYLDLSTGGTFTRSSLASYYTGAPTDGSTAFLAWAPTNTRRIENRGDGLGDMLLMEGMRTNTAVYSEDMTVGNWSRTNGFISNSLAAPDGRTSAVYLTGNVSSNIKETISSIVWLNDVTASMSTFVLAPSGTTGIKMIQLAKDATLYKYDISPTSTWGRFDFISSSHSGAGGSQIGTFVTTASTTWSQWGFQLETGSAFPSSYISTSNVSAARAQDQLTYAAGQYPSSFITRGFTIQIAPDFSSAEQIATAASVRLLGFGASSHIIEITYTVGTIIMRCLESSANRITTNPTTLSWSRGQLLTITVSPNNGTMTLSGFTSGNGTYTGTAFSWPNLTLNIGSTPATFSLPFFGRIGTTVTAL